MSAPFGLSPRRRATRWSGLLTSLTDAVASVSSLLDRCDEGARMNALEQALADAREALA